MISRSRPTDFRNLDIYPEDTVVYPVRQGSAMWLVEGIVLEVTDDAIKVNVEGRKPAWVKRLDRVVVVDAKFDPYGI